MKRPEKKIPVGLLGATGTVGQRFVTLLADHPWFEIGFLTASERSAGKRYWEAVQWVQSRRLPAEIGELTLLPGAPSDWEGRLVFSALESSVASEIEARLARDGYLVVSNTSAHRMDEDVPLVVPEVNPSHLELARHSRYAPGAILTNPNCSTIGLTLALKPLWESFGIRRIQVVTMQAISGAGLPGIASYQIQDNVIPFIPGEEEKIERESRKIFGTLDGSSVRPAELAIGAQCHRVPVLDGHLLAVSVELGTAARAGELREAWRSFSVAGGPDGKEGGRFPSAPSKPIYFWDEESWPQPRLHRDLDRGMAVSVGRLRDCPILDFKFVTLSHNTLRGADGGALLLAELAVARGLLTGVETSQMISG